MAISLNECMSKQSDRDALALFKDIEKKNRKKMKTITVGNHTISYTAGREHEVKRFAEKNQ